MCYYTIELPEQGMYIVSFSAIYMGYLQGEKEGISQYKKVKFIALLSELSSLQALDTFNAAIVSPIYYVMFTTLTIAASAIMFKVDSLTGY